MSRVFALSVHATYRCAHSGACCTAGWAIPVEASKQAALGAAVLVADADGACRFFDRGTRLCGVHRDAGESAKPDSCRHFPRVALIDDRGTHVTLSHFCPTAARLLFDVTTPLEIVDSPPAFPRSDTYEGLDARGEWPPLVHETLLFDLDAYQAWERFVVSTFTAEDDSTRALARIAGVAEVLRRWTPPDGAMATRVQRLAESADFAPLKRSRYDEPDLAPPRRSDPIRGSRHDAADVTPLHRYAAIRASARAIVIDAIPEPLRALASHTAASTGSVPGAGNDGRARRAAGHEGAAAGTEPPSVICRFLAAKAFASWTAYQGRGVRTLIAELVLADALVRELAADRPLIEAIREADRLLVHLSDRTALIARLGVVEDTA